MIVNDSLVPGARYTSTLREEKEEEEEERGGRRRRRRRREEEEEEKEREEEERDQDTHVWLGSSPVLSHSVWVSSYLDSWVSSSSGGGGETSHPLDWALTHYGTNDSSPSDRWMDRQTSVWCGRRRFGATDRSQIIQ